MSEPTSPDLGPPERLHPLFLLSSFGGSVRQLAGGYAVLGYLVVSGQLRTALALAAGLFAIMLVSMFLYWRNFHFRVGSNEIRIDSGILSRTHRSIPFERVQDVDISQGPLARLTGVAALRFETGGASGGNADEGVLAAIPLQRAEEIRALVRGQRSALPVELAEPETGERSPVYAMDLRRVLLAGLFNFSLALFAGLFGLTQTMGDVLGFDPLNARFWSNVLDPKGPLAEFLVAHRAVAVAAGVMLLLLAGAATGLVRTVLRDFGFRLDRTETSLRRRRGLLTRTDVSLPLRRVQAAILSTGPVRDLFGWRALSLQNLAQDEGSGDHDVAPLATEEEVAKIVVELGWQPLGPEIEWRRISRAYVWIFAIALSPLLLILGLQVAVLGATPLLVDETQRASIVEASAPLLIPLLVIAASLLVVIAGRLLAWKRTAFALDGDRLLVRTGWWRRRLRILPVSKIQSIDIAESFLSRWFGVSNLIFGVAGGRGFSAHNIPAVRQDEARELRKRLLLSGA